VVLGFKVPRFGAMWPGLDMIASSLLRFQKCVEFLFIARVTQILAFSLSEFPKPKFLLCQGFQKGTFFFARVSERSVFFANIFRTISFS
jgi:hypothetical protein